VFVSGFPDPPYFLLVAGLLAGLASGKAFEVTLKQLVHEWARTRSSRILSNLHGSQLLVPYLGMCAGVCVFLASGLTVFGFPTQLSCLLSVLLTLGTAALIWSQLGKLLILLEQGGSRAIDLDTLEESKK
jgi:hypothetical protein